MGINITEEPPHSDFENYRLQLRTAESRDHSLLSDHRLPLFKPVNQSARLLSSSVSVPEEFVPRSKVVALKPTAPITPPPNFGPVT